MHEGADSAVTDLLPGAARGSQQAPSGGASGTARLLQLALPGEDGASPQLTLVLKYWKMFFRMSASILDSTSSLGAYTAT